MAKFKGQLIVTVDIIAEKTFDAQSIMEDMSQLVTFNPNHAVKIAAVSTGVQAQESSPLDQLELLTHRTTDEKVAGSIPPTQD